MKKDNDTIKVSSESKLQLPLANLIGIIIVVSGAVFGYANLTGRISSLETADTLFAADLLKKAEQEPKNLEMYMLIEHLAGQIESIEKEIEASRYNKVNIDHLKEQIISIQKVIDKLRNGTH
jgi:hypothetical protein|nr:Fibrinogen-like coiled coil protein [uncultured Mediterranean phage uvMED]|tara:strand:+ start:332 stop:697 length:366 start_codon:yes stop_codon:yes gene_type:complete